MKRFIYLLILTTSIYAEEAHVVDLDRFNIYLKVDADGDVNPSVVIPIDWGDFYSAVGYESKLAIVHTDLGAEYAPSKYLTEGRSKYFWLDVIGSHMNFEDSYFSYSFTVGYRDMEILQYGYFHLTDPTTLDKETMAVDITKNLKMYSTGLYLDYTYKNLFDRLSFRVSTHVYPYSYLKVNESVAYMPLIPEVGKGESSQRQDISYDINLDMVIRIISSLSLGISAQYEYLPYKYTSLVPRTDALAYHYTDTQDNATTKSAGVRLLFSKFSFVGIEPVIGYERSVLSVESLYEGITSTETSKSNNYMFGFEKKF